MYERFLEQIRNQSDREMAEANHKNKALAGKLTDYLATFTLQDPVISHYQPAIKVLEPNQESNQPLEVRLQWGKTNPTPEEATLLDQKEEPLSGVLRRGQPNEIVAEKVRFVRFTVENGVISVHTKPEEIQNGLPQTLNEMVYRFDPHIDPENSQQELEDLHPEELYSYGKYKDDFMHVSLPDVIGMAIRDPFQHQVIYEKIKNGTYSEKKADVASRAA